MDRCDKMFSLQATVAAIEATANTEEDDIETPPNDLEAGDEAKILWCINYDRFKQEFRDQVIVQAVTRRIDASAGALIRLMLNLMNENSPWAHVSCHLRLNEILDKLEKAPNNEENMELREFHDQYFKVKWLIIMVQIESELEICICLMKRHHFYLRYIP